MNLYGIINLTSRRAIYDFFLSFLFLYTLDKFALNPTQKMKYDIYINGSIGYPFSVSFIQDELAKELYLSEKAGILIV